MRYLIIRNKAFPLFDAQILWPHEIVYQIGKFFFSLIGRGTKREYIIPTFPSAQLICYPFFTRLKNSTFVIRHDSHLSLKALSIWSAQAEQFFFISLPQNLNTSHPCSSRACVTSISLSIVRSILGIQNSCLDLISYFLFSQSNPCQNSLSQKTAIFFPIKAISGFPKIVFTFFLYLSPRDHNSFRRATSIAESLFFTRLIL